MLESYIHQFFDAFSDAVCITDRDGIILLVNTKHAEMTGVPREKILGRNTQSLVDEGVFDTVMNPRVVREKKSAVCVQRVVTGRTVVLAGHPVFDARGELHCVITFIRDITVLSSLKDEIAHQKELLAAFQCLNKKHEKEPPLTMVSEAMHGLFQEIAGLLDAEPSNRRDGADPRADGRKRRKTRPCADSSSIEFNSIDMEGKSFKEIMRELEAVVIKAGMKRYGTIAETAKHFRVDRSTIFRKVKSEV